MKTDKKITPEDITPAIKSAVNAVLMAKAMALVQRERVDQIERRILAQATYRGMPEWIERGLCPARILDPKETYMIREEDQEDYRAEWQIAIDALGYKLPRDHCPALIAEDLQRQAEAVLIEAAEPVFGVTKDQLFQSAKGLENYRRYIDLLCGLVVKLPGYKNPLTGKAVS
jgi:hypothetical protein